MVEEFSYRERLPMVGEFGTEAGEGLVSLCGVDGGMAAQCLGTEVGSCVKIAEGKVSFGGSREINRGTTGKAPSVERRLRCGEVVEGSAGITEVEGTGPGKHVDLGIVDPVTPFWLVIAHSRQ
jgi:hypothetical protein